MTLEERRQLEVLTHAVNDLNVKVTQGLTELKTELKSYPQVKDQVFTNKDRITQLKTAGGVTVAILTLLITAVGAVASVAALQ